MKRQRRGKRRPQSGRTRSDFQAADPPGSSLSWSDSCSHPPKSSQECRITTLSPLASCHLLSWHLSRTQMTSSSSSSSPICSPELISAVRSDLQVLSWSNRLGSAKTASRPQTQALLNRRKCDNKKLLKKHVWTRLSLERESDGKSEGPVYECKHETGLNC